MTYHSLLGRFALLLALVIAARPQAGCAETLVLADRTTWADFVSMGDDLTLTFARNDAPLHVSADDLIYWGRYDDRPATSRAILSDGSVLAGELAALDQRTVALTSPTWGRVELPRESLRGVVLTLPPDTQSRDRLMSRMLSPSEPGDQILLANGDRLFGELSAAADAGDVVTSFQVVPDGIQSPLLLDAENVVGIILAPPPRDEAAARRMEIGFRDGSRLMVGRIRNDTQRGSVSVELVCGSRFESPTERVWPAVNWIQSIGFGRVTYLSDLETAGYKQIPFLDLRRDWKRDRNVLDGHLRVRGRRFSKGIGMMPASRLAFSLAGDEATFRAELALDDLAGARGSVVFRVFLASEDEAEGRLAWKSAYDSPIVRGGEPPIPIVVELRGALGLALLVDFAERGDELDYANWLNPRLVR